MIARFTLAALAATLLAGSALALVSREEAAAIATPRNETVIEMNQMWPMTGPIAVEPCATETCDDI
jgi:hypothetical protein